MNNHLLKLSKQLLKLGFKKEANQVIKIAQALNSESVINELKEKGISIEDDLKSSIERYVKFMNLAKYNSEKIEAATSENLAKKIKDKYPTNQDIFDAIDSIYNERNTSQQPPPQAERPKERRERENTSQQPPPEAERPKQRREPDYEKIESIIKNNQKMITKFNALEDNKKVVKLSNGKIGTITSFNPETRFCKITQNSEEFEIELDELKNFNEPSWIPFVKDYSGTITTLEAIPQPELIELPIGSKILLLGMSWVPPIAQYAIWNEKTIEKINNKTFKIVKPDADDLNNEIVTKLESL